MRAFVAVVTVFLVAMASYYFLTGYRSAFEADQACHSEKWHSYGENPSFDCDHDLETDQWILYEVMPNNLPAKVIKRFRY